MNEHLMPLIVVEPDLGRFEHLLDGARAQVYDQQDAAILQVEQQVVFSLARVQQETAGLPRLEEERDLVAGTQDGLGVQRLQVEGQVVGTAEGSLGWSAL
ncbi:uncharacterized protein CDAR_583811 [Caerostris darwini]|uniref:Uncharacterized protein n=1 Tax=Caerostris darwini TaxID=1538125 RepID=A0AAV4RID1_9ARAC|nr:uncharacterized protein CDAR_583811 [Caerostris darwini]